MGTTLSEVYDLFVMTVTDYRLSNLYTVSEEDFENYLQGFLEFAISDFIYCNQDLEYDDTTKEFPVTLTRANKTILAKLMMKHWMQKNVNDITQMNLHIMDRDFKVASEAMNLREKVAALNSIKEECSQLLSDYYYKNNSWSDWYNQVFDDGV